MARRVNGTPQQPNPPRPQAPHASAAEQLIFEKGLPCNIDAERFCLGSILLNDSNFDVLSPILNAEIFHLEKHRRIWRAIEAVREQSMRIDRVTVAEILRRRGELESVDGLSYLVSLDDGLPEIANLTDYARIIQKKAQLRSIIFQSQAAINRSLRDDEDPGEIAARLQDGLESAAPSAAEDLARTPMQIVDQFPGGISTFLDPSLRPKGLSYGFSKLDELTNGMHAGELIVLGARPSQGKTSLLMNIAANVCLNPRIRKSFAIFSLETTSDTLITRMMCAHGRVDSHKFRAGFLNAEERHRLQVALSEVMDSRMTLYDKFGITLPEIAREVKRLVKEEGLHACGIDYLGLIGSKGTSENRNREIEDMARRLKILAGECGIPIILLSQLSRRCEERPGDHRPMLSDLRDSGGIEATADVVLFLYRAEFYKKSDESVKGMAELIIGKQRAGPCSTVNLRFIGGIGKFENRADDLFDHEPEG